MRALILPALLALLPATAGAQIDGDHSADCTFTRECVDGDQCSDTSFTIQISPQAGYAITDETGTVADAYRFYMSRTDHGIAYGEIAQDQIALSGYMRFSVYMLTQGPDRHAKYSVHDFGDDKTFDFNGSCTIN